MVDQTQIDAWKKQHGEITEVSVKVSDEDTAKCYLKPADDNRTIMARGLSLSAKGMLLECGEFILDNCWLGGDERFKEEGRVRISGAMQAAQAVEMLEGSQKKI
ncbi:MAG: hypothetical protein LPK03_08895 [Pontibacter sp.]|nr:hypothetical protein [Pontibacter sp.]